MHKVFIDSNFGIGHALHLKCGVGVYHFPPKGAIFFVINLIKMSSYHPLEFSK